MKSTIIGVSKLDSCTEKHEDTQPVAHELAHEIRFTADSLELAPVDHPLQNETVTRHPNEPFTRISLVATLPLLRTS